MFLFIFMVFFTPYPCSADMKTLIESMHGPKMLVKYQVLNSGRHILLVQEKASSPTDKANIKQRQMLDLDMKEGEVYSPYYGFQCNQKANAYVYAVISKSRAKEKGTFQPERAWRIDEKSALLRPINNVESVVCVWSPEGESSYPFR